MSKWSGGLAKWEIYANLIELSPDYAEIAKSRISSDKGALLGLMEGGE